MCAFVYMCATLLGTGKGKVIRDECNSWRMGSCMKGKVRYIMNRCPKI